MEPILLVHGGAGDIPEDRVPGKMKGVKHATRMGYTKLQETGSVMDAVEVLVLFYILKHIYEKYFLYRKLYVKWKSMNISMLGMDLF